ncbi:MAG TPA: FAD-dependent oxidoreductase [Candidatus Polarisedimenticolia bacterium]|jgi:thioredoxin reductase (NADPH)|nr:FAD-dependent oxidoreductase [Candidatus Polarisedimenticolia bacterium]
MAEQIDDERDAFPPLTAAQIERLRPFTTPRDLRDGEIVWEAGDRNRPMYIVERGEIEIRSGADHVVTVHTQGAFTGDVDLLSGRPVVVRAIARGATHVLELPATRLRDVIQIDPELSEIFLRAFLKRRAILMQQGGGNVVLIGSRHCAGTLNIQEFLTRNRQPHTYLDVEADPSVQETLDRLGATVDDIPILICRGDLTLKSPTIEQVAECLGLDGRMNELLVRDVVVIGAGPAGLSAAVYAASEGLDVLVIESRSPGGQAGSSSRIENYLGFPTGIPGEDLAANAFTQAEKFGAEFAVARTALRLDCGRPYRVELGPGIGVQARAIVIASGVRYRKPDIPDLARFEGVGVYYGATEMEGNLCRGEDAIVVGGGNSAGQAAVFLAGKCRKVTVMVRKPGLQESMSRYLIRRIEETPNITLRTKTQIVAMEGKPTGLERVTWRDGDGKTTTGDIRHVFLMTGADPNTAWLQNCIRMDDKGYVKTGSDLDTAALSEAAWPFSRPPFLFETSRPGVFAIGDVRAGSVKRVAAAVGEGSVCIQLVHKVLAESLA